MTIKKEPPFDGSKVQELQESDRASSLIGYKYDAGFTVCILVITRTTLITDMNTIVFHITIPLSNNHRGTLNCSACVS
jgi:hypothetical protein